jgi:hypothetical protein
VNTEASQGAKDFLNAAWSECERGKFPLHLRYLRPQEFETVTQDWREILTRNIRVCPINPFLVPEPEPGETPPSTWPSQFFDGIGRYVYLLHRQHKSLFKSGHREEVPYAKLVAPKDMPLFERWFHVYLAKAPTQSLKDWITTNGG